MEQIDLELYIKALKIYKEQKGKEVLKTIIDKLMK